jgi:biotin synthase
MMPDKEIRICGGREHNLRDLQSWIFAAGADGMMIGGYLTLAGRGVEEDLQMIRDAGMVPVGPGIEG